MTSGNAASLPPAGAGPAAAEDQQGPARHVGPWRWQRFVARQRPPRCATTALSVWLAAMGEEFGESIRTISTSVKVSIGAVCSRKGWAAIVSWALHRAETETRNEDGDTYGLRQQLHAISVSAPGRSAPNAPARPVDECVLRRDTTDGDDGGIRPCWLAARPCPGAKAPRFSSRVGSVTARTGARWARLTRGSFSRRPTSRLSVGGSVEQRMSSTADGDDLASLGDRWVSVAVHGMGWFGAGHGPVASGGLSRGLCR